MPCNILEQYIHRPAELYPKFVKPGQTTTKMQKTMKPFYSKLEFTRKKTSVEPWVKELNISKPEKLISDRDQFRIKAILEDCEISTKILLRETRELEHVNDDVKKLCDWCEEQTKQLEWMTVKEKEEKAKLAEDVTTSEVL